MGLRFTMLECVLATISECLKATVRLFDNPNVRYDIFRDNELVRTGSPAVSQVDSFLEPNTKYVHTVDLVLNGLIAQSRSIELTTSSL